PNTTLAVLIGVPPPWRDNVSTTVGSPFASVRLFPMNRTRPPARSFLRDGSVGDGASDAELQLATTAAATITVTTECFTPSARVMGYRAPRRHPRGRCPRLSPDGHDTRSRGVANRPGTVRP